MWLKTGMICLVLTAMLAACAHSAPQSDSSDSAMQTNGPARFLALGDSYTIGEAVASDVRWPGILARKLRRNGVAIENPVVIAKTGWTTEELADYVASIEFGPAYDLVTLLIGVNDQYRNYPVEAYAPRFESMLERAIELAGGRPQHVLVISIPDWGVTPFARKDERGRAVISSQIDAYNAVNQRIAREHGTHYVNITDISRRVDDNITLVANDGLHPSGRQYRLWVERIYPVAYKILTGRQP